MPRAPCIFSGNATTQDANKWLKDFDRIATYNRWDEQMRLANVVFYLADTARQWFDNNEDKISNWTEFCKLLEEAFCQKDERKHQAERTLLTRAQRVDETSESYIQDVLSLGHRVNPSMPEDEKVAHIMKGIIEDLYQTLIVQEYRTAEELVARCRLIENLRRRRIAPTKYQRLPNVATISEDDLPDNNDMRSLIRTIVREEIKRLMPEIKNPKDVPNSTVDIASIVREEICEALAPFTASPRQETMSSRRSFPERPQPRRVQRGTPIPQRRTDRWRTDDNIPVCFHCGRAGHVMRYCRDRRQVFANARASGRASPITPDEDSGSTYSYEEADTHPVRSNYRSSSPYPRRTFSRRQSQSPTRRPSRSPRRVNTEN